MRKKIKLSVLLLVLAIVVSGISACSKASDKDQASTNPFKGKTASFYGDSLTEVNKHYTKGYHAWVSEILELESYQNYGKSRLTIADVYYRVNYMDDPSDIIFIMCGVNDQTFSVPLGEMGDNTTDTTYGALELLCSLVKERYADRTVVFITPHYQTTYRHKEGTKSADIAEAMKEVCEKHDITVYDNYTLSEITHATLSAYTTDKCHWNDLGHEKVGKNLAQFMLDTYGDGKEELKLAE